MKRKLTDSFVKTAQSTPEGKLKNYTDGGGMYLHVKPTGKFWRYNYRLDGKKLTLTIGRYPETSLKEARQRHEEARALLSRGVDPSRYKQTAKNERLNAVSNSFETVACEWFVKFSSQWVPDHANRIIRRLEQDVFPWLGNRPIADIEPPDVLDCLERIQARGALETAHRVKQSMGQVFRYAVVTRRATRDPTPDLKGALPAPQKRNFSAITDPLEVGQLMRAIEEYTGTLETRIALQLSAYLFTRPGELRQMEWAEIDMEAERWVIPAEKMKMRKEHIVPLSTQALALLEETKPLTGRWTYVFPSMTDKRKPMSNNTVRQALRRLGYDNDTMTAHGFRALASTRLYEMGFQSDLIEKQLAHTVGNDVRRAYDRSQHIEGRTTMMQAWADYLDQLREGGHVIPFKAKSR